MNREEFLISYWKYYTILEDDFITLTRYVSIDEHNYKTYSDEIMKQILSVVSEFENICKVICEFKGSQRITIKNIAECIFDKIEDIKSVEIVVKHTKDIKLNPFSKWEKNNSSELFWWKGYNSVKHNRRESYMAGNLQNLLNALAALYYMELYLVRKIGRNNGDKDVPNSVSKLFEIVNFETKDTVIGYDLYTMTDEDCEEIIELFK